MLFKKKRPKKQEPVRQEKPTYTLSSVWPSREIQEIAMKEDTNSKE